ncbi:DUF4142 domain-containing protein [Sphaerisporangium rufum]|uniref:DUF4142 domain-containing protein n=1 Tax=Sphaerisporangium rufum TaxID=1381558 RepID=UPI0019515E06|nr:DUF4142 domain-containing protein [Sphaerisporangium rufum]
MSAYGGPVPMAPPAEQLIEKQQPPAQEPQADPAAADPAAQDPAAQDPAAQDPAADPAAQAGAGDPAAAAPAADPGQQGQNYPTTQPSGDNGGVVTEAVGQETVSTPWGPLTAADRDLVAKVRLAGLWEIPVGREAAKRASRAATRKNLGEIARQHVLLDAEDRQVAAKLRIPLPDEPNADQQAWIAEISSKKGLEYDKTAVLRLRLAHGKIFPAIGAVRASTRNTLIREFAQSCANFVNTHMGLLEGTGLAGSMAMPPAPTVSGAPDTVPSGEPAPSAPPATTLDHIVNH